MTDTEKPFACSSSGCNMSFANEDHLTVHKKKHDMVLNLGSTGKNTVFIDQTPTPTRFIRNCEEIGLFQDLQNVNPFEETFRRAVEAGKPGTLTLPETAVTDDTLHTPHIFPHIEDDQTSNNRLQDRDVHGCSTTLVSAEKEKDTNESEICSNLKLVPSETSDLMKEKDLHVKDNNILSNVHITVLPKLQPLPATPPLSINGEEVQLLLRTSDGKLMQLSAMPVRDNYSTTLNTINQIKQSSVLIKTELPVRSGNDDINEAKLTVPKLSLAKMKLKQILSKNAEFPNQRAADIPSKKENQKELVDVNKKLDILERNRASSMRARAKRKAWIQQLQRTVSNVNEINVVLQTEVKTLRAEVSKLKALLLAHKDCPVTKAMQKGNSIVLGPKIISVNPEVISLPISNIPVNNVSSKRLHTSNIAPSPKKKLSLSTTKSPVIFPKIDINIAPPIQTAALVKNLPSLKLLDVNQFITEKEEHKQILIVQSTQKNIIETTANRQIIQINPNYEMENAASKSTGA
ncbi:cyclic AMP-dependent transcription factor ATF-7 isoform X2 [Prorops nasuta]|uniref:cyclic AMP-dependent transcription factor ATF-7 isoform X2 n=1 Tax=Prorops nasuta TaxID=863751 RepID=UPI0034D01FA9